MDIGKHLDQLDREMADATMKSDRAEQDYKSNKLPWRESKLKGIWQRHQTKLDKIFAERTTSLERKPKDPGLRAPLLSHNQSGCHLQNAWHRLHSAYMFLPFTIR